MSTSGSAQLPPRVLSACERLDEAIAQLSKAVKAQGDKVDVQELNVLNDRIEGLEADNLALSKALEAYNDADYDTQFEKLNDEIDQLRAVNENLTSRHDEILDVKNEVSERLAKLIGQVELVLEEDE